MIRDGEKTRNLLNLDTFLLKIEKKNFEKIKETEYVGEELGQGDKDYGVGGISKALILAPKFKKNLAITQHGFSSENKIFLRFEDATRFLAGKNLFK